MATETANRKPGMWMTDAYERDEEPQRVVAIEYQDGWPVSVLTELHWDHSHKPWYKPEMGKPSGTCPEHWDFDYVKRDGTLYFHNSGGGGKLYYNVCRFVQPSPPQAKLWVAPGIPIVDSGKSGTRVSDAQLLKRGYLRIPKPLLLPMPWSKSRTRNPFEAGEEGRTIWCDRCAERLHEGDGDPCEHMEWCDGCAMWVYTDTRQLVGENEDSKCDCEQEDDEDEDD